MDLFWKVVRAFRRPAPDDQLDGCKIEPGDPCTPDELVCYVALSPEADPEKIEEYGRLFGKGS